VAYDRIVRGDADGALPLLVQAVQADPTFAMAHRLLARVYSTTGRAAQEREHLERAFEHRDKLSQKERLHVEASYLKGRGEYAKAADTLTAAVNLFPADLESRYELAVAYRDAGQRGKTVEQQEVLAADRYFSVLAYGTLALQFVRDGDPARARTIYEAAQERNVKAPQLDWAYGLVLLLERRMEEARAQFRALEASRVYADIARLMLANADILEGNLTAARERLRAELTAGQRQKDVSRAEVKQRYVLARLYLLEGDQREAAEQLQAMAGGAAPPLANELLMAGSLAAAAGDSQRAAQMLRRLDGLRTEAPDAFVESCYDALPGEIALAEGRGAEAAERFRSAALHYPSPLVTQGLAHALGSQGEWARSRDAWATVVDAGGELLRLQLGLDWVLAHLELARASRNAGDLAGAAAQYDRFLEFWKHGDGLALVRRAAAERQALGRPN
jgi:eukaryotic-like serine/threonine-protein kinase